MSVSLRGEEAAMPAADVRVLDDKLLFMDMPTDPPGDPRNPYADYAKARDAHPVLVEEGRFGDGGPLTAFIYKHADVVEVFHDNETFSSRALHDFMSPFMGQYVLVGMDEPAHGRYRNLLAPAMRPKLLARWETTLIDKVADELIDAIADRGEADLVKDFNFSYPAQIIARIVGVPQENFIQFQRWAVDIVGGLGDPAAGIAASQALRAYLAPFVAARRQHPQDDLISELVKAELDGERLIDDEIYSFLLLLLPAGIETTFRSIGNLLFNLLGNPEQLEAVRNDRNLVTKAVEENLRMDSPIQTPPRVATRATQIRGVDIPAGTIVVPLIGSANHDPELNDDPDRFDIFRPTMRHVTFGNGVHTCMGLHLAKLETRMALNKLLDRLPGLRFDREKARALDAHMRGKAFRSPTCLPVLWDR
jgi:cytochrome P450